jgi:hypothetical protein
MTGSQSGRRNLPDGAPDLGSLIRRRVEPLVAAGLAAHAAVVGFTAFSASAPLLTALVVTLVFAGVSLAYGRLTGAVVGPSPGRLAGGVLADAVVLGIVAVGGWLIGRALGTGTTFYCEPLVPWRIEIALFGSFSVAYFTGMARQRGRAWAAYPLAVVALLWIAPFYGFFSAPLFLGVSLTAMCPGRPIVSVILAALGLRVGEQVGLAAVRWISGAVPPGGDA